MPGPSLQNFIVPRRGRISSGNYNDQMISIQNDILSAFRGIQTVDKRMLAFLRQLNFQNQILEARIENVKNDAHTAQVIFFAQNGTKLLHASFWDNTAISDINTLNHDRVHGQIILQATNSWSHIPVIRNAQDRLVPVSDVTISTSTIYLSSQSEFIEIEQPDDIYSSINKSPTDIWTHTWPNYPAPSNGGIVGLELEISLPEPISPAINTFIVHPFPYWASDVSSVKVLTAGGAWQSLSNWPLSGALSNVAWYFNSIDYLNKFRVKFLGFTSLVDEYLENVRIIGAANMDIGFTEFAQEGSATLMFEAPSAEINYLRSFQADFTLNAQQVPNRDDYLWFEVFKDSKLTTKVYDSRSDPFPMVETDSPIDVRSGGTSIIRLWVRVNMNRVHSTTPTLKDITMTYV